MHIFDFAASNSGLKLNSQIAVFIKVLFKKKYNGRLSG